MRSNSVFNIILNETVTIKLSICVSSTALPMMLAISYGSH